MLRVGLTGELGSGKSTVARLLAQHGATVLSSDEMGRALMQPGEGVYRAIVAQFGPEVVLPDGQLDRPALARLAFDPEHGRIQELNAIVHPAVFAEQERAIQAIGAAHPDAILVVESALIFSARYTGTEEPWRKRFDVVVLVTAPDALKIERHVQRSTLRGTGMESEAASRLDAQKRLAAQRVPAEAQTDFVLVNDEGLDELRQKVDALWRELQSRQTREG